MIPLPFADRPTDTRLSRREWFKLASAGVIGCSMSGWLERLAHAAGKSPERRRSCILLWMAGGPTQMDTFDLKPGNANGGPYKAIDTAAPAIKISEHLPQLAKLTDRMAIVRSMSTKEGDHGRATYFLRTGYLPQGPIQYPALGALVARELGKEEDGLPSFVSVSPLRFFSPAAYGSGFLGPLYDPLIVGNADPFNVRGQVFSEDSLKVKDLDLPRSIHPARADARVELLQNMERNFVPSHPDLASLSHETAYNRAVKLMRSEAGKAFNVENEPDKVRDAYGRTPFGQGCLLARRLVERGVPFIEVTLDGWDTHQQNFDQVKSLSGTLDPAWATLMADLKDRGLLDSTLIVWMGEFGRTPKINNSKGRDHFPNAWSTVLAGGGIKGGQVIGKTSADGMTIEDRPVSVPDFLATVCQALGIDPMKQNQSNVGRPIRIVDKAATPIQEALA
jgi:uncharacterized protein (DUF1501 family)